VKHRLIAGTINYYYAEPGWTNTHLDVTARGIYDGERGMFVQPEIVADLSKELPMIQDAAFDEVKLHHVLEHMTREQATHSLRAIHRILKPDGVLDIEVPDLNRVCRAWVEGELDLDGLNQWLYGEQLGEEADLHRFGWTAESLRLKLQAEGFDVPGAEDTGHAVRFRARKIEVGE
jgi:SAM-dependent methyltransferase